ncbi:putative plant self-incompatibility S1 [Lupinus albus]|uniref:S-protein homolog n=1 Tax=Lupinus albus TaxID=3870 RepID=A0A6A4NZS1_LUPAL|nr:putative plant self-incompatibility S1 [Lupinus albus]
MFLSISKKHVFSLALVIAFWEAFHVVTGESRVTVSVRNYLPNGLNATIHCKSGDDDVGVHVVPNCIFNEPPYKLRFNPNIFHTTLYFCGISWKEASMVYDLYTYKRDHERCGHDCLWDIQKGGIMGYSIPGHLSIYEKWQKHNAN